MRALPERAANLPLYHRQHTHARLDLAFVEFSPYSQSILYESLHVNFSLPGAHVSHNASHPLCCSTVEEGPGYLGFARFMDIQMVHGYDRKLAVFFLSFL